MIQAITIMSIQGCSCKLYGVAWQQKKNDSDTSNVDIWQLIGHHILPILMVSGFSTNPCTLWICSSPDSGTIGPITVLPLLPRITVKRKYAWFFKTVFSDWDFGYNSYYWSNDLQWNTANANEGAVQVKRLSRCTFELKVDSAMKRTSTPHLVAK